MSALFSASIMICYGVLITLSYNYECFVLCIANTTKMYHSQKKRKTVNVRLWWLPRTKKRGVFYLRLKISSLNRLASYDEYPPAVSVQFLAVGVTSVANFSVRKVAVSSPKSRQKSL